MTQSLLLVFRPILKSTAGGTPSPAQLALALRTLALLHLPWKDRMTQSLLLSPRPWLMRVTRLANFLSELWQSELRWMTSFICMGSNASTLKPKLAIVSVNHPMFALCEVRMMGRGWISGIS